MEVLNDTVKVSQQALITIYSADFGSLLHCRQMGYLFRFDEMVFYWKLSLISRHTIFVHGKVLTLSVAHLFFEI